MGQFEKMRIPEVADGKVNNLKQFNEQARANEARLSAEIADSKEGSGFDELAIDHEDSIEFVPFKNRKMSPGQLAKIAKGRKVIGFGLLNRAS